MNKETFDKARIIQARISELRSKMILVDLVDLLPELCEEDLDCVGDVVIQLLLTKISALQDEFENL